MTQLLLDGAKIRAGSEKVRGTTVPQCVRVQSTYTVCQTCFPNDPPCRTGAESLVVSVQKQRPVRWSERQPGSDRFGSGRAEGDDPLFLAFAHHSHKSAVQIEILDIQRYGLGYTKSRTIHQLK